MLYQLTSLPDEMLVGSLNSQYSLSPGKRVILRPLAFSRRELSSLPDERHERGCAPRKPSFWGGGYSLS